MQSVSLLCLHDHEIKWVEGSAKVQLRQNYRMKNNHKPVPTTAKRNKTCRCKWNWIQSNIIKHQYWKAKWTDKKIQNEQNQTLSNKDKKRHNQELLRDKKDTQSYYISVTGLRTHAHCVARWWCFICSVSHNIFITAQLSSCVPPLCTLKRENIIRRWLSAFLVILC